MTPYRTDKNGVFYIICNLSNTASTNGIGAWDNFCGIFTAEEARQIDVKIDDGKPLSGSWFGFGGYSSRNDCLLGTEYKLTNTSRECQAIYVFDK